MRRKIIAVLGDARIPADGEKYRLAFELGKALADAGYRVQSGGLGGVMEAVFAGVKSSEHYREGDTIAIVPSFDSEQANEYADIVIPTGLDLLRNAIVANADACIAMGGGAGTLSEMALSWTLKRLLLAYRNVEGWSAKLADTRIDEKPRVPGVEDDRVFGVTCAEEAVAILKSRLPLYTARHTAIPFMK